MRLSFFLVSATMQISYQLKVEPPKIEEIDCGAIAVDVPQYRIVKSCKGTKYLAANVPAWTSGFVLLKWYHTTQTELNQFISTVENIRYIHFSVKDTGVQHLVMNFTKMKKIVCQKKGVAITIVNNKILETIELIGNPRLVNCSSGLLVKGNPNLKKETIEKLKATYPDSTIQNYKGKAKPSNKGKKFTTATSSLITTSTRKNTRFPVVTRMLTTTTTPKVSTLPGTKFQATTTLRARTIEVAVSRKVISTKSTLPATRGEARRMTEVTMLPRTSIEATSTLTARTTDLSTTKGVAAPVSTTTTKETTTAGLEIKDEKVNSSPKETLQTTRLMKVTSAVDIVLESQGTSPSHPITTTSINDDDTSGNEHFDEYPGEEKRPYAQEFDIPIYDDGSCFAKYFSSLSLIIFKLTFDYIL